MAEESRPRLGRGLAALIGDAGEEGAAIARSRGQKRFRSLSCGPIRAIRARPSTIRISKTSSLRSARRASSSRSSPVPSRALPIFTRSSPASGAGARRSAPGCTTRRSILVEADDKQALELAIVENVQRADLNALEEALGYQQLENEYGYTQADLAKVIGKSRSHVANTLRLLKLPEKTKQLLAEGKLSAGHARALLTRADAGRDRRAHRRARAFRARCREARAKNGAAAKHQHAAEEKDADTRALEKDLSEALGLLVSIAHHGEAGELRIRYKSLEQLDDVVRRVKPSCALTLGRSKSWHIPPELEGGAAPQLKRANPPSASLEARPPTARAGRSGRRAWDRAAPCRWPD